MLTRWPLPDLAVLEGRRPRPFDPHRLLQELDRGGVAHVVVGGLAEVLHGAPYDTDDVDIVLTDPESLAPLAAMLTLLDARVIDDHDQHGLGLDWTPELLATAARLPFNTEAGRLDVIGAPGFGQRSLASVERETVELGDLSVEVATLDWLIAAKDASPSRVHRRAVPTLLALRDEIQG